MLQETGAPRAAWRVSAMAASPLAQSLGQIQNNGCPLLEKQLQPFGVGLHDIVTLTAYDPQAELFGGELSCVQHHFHRGVGPHGCHVEQPVELVPRKHRGKPAPPPRELHRGFPLILVKKFLWRKWIDQIRESEGAMHWLPCSGAPAKRRQLFASSMLAETLPFIS